MADDRMFIFAVLSSFCTVLQ